MREMQQSWIRFLGEAGQDAGPTNGAQYASAAAREAQPDQATTLPPRQLTFTVSATRQ